MSPIISITLTATFLLLFASVVFTAAAGGKACKNPSKRHEWRTLSNGKKAEYISAVKCSQSLPAIGPVKAAKTRFDDFQAIHIALADEVHLVGQFLPWHRRMLNVYEKALREECGFNGTVPYWDWSLDIAERGSIVNSPVLDPVHGFGGNGIDIPDYDGFFHNSSLIPGWKRGTGGGCITDGPFVSYNLSLGPGTLVTNHCITRAFTDALADKISYKQVANTTKQPTFERFRTELEGITVTPTVKIHDGGHFSVGGEMSNVYSSPGDPLFYLHHANLDRIWWNWQHADLKTRLYAISGRSSVDPPFTNVTLDFNLKMNGLAPLVQVREVMDIRNELLCYEYV